MARLYMKVSSQPLRNMGFDERWLQSRIAEDPTILGLGDLRVVERERSMIGGGRLDVLLADIGENTRYEVELMLGKLDESHIIRAIEYWDIERRRYPSLDHVAVIVAEDITSRFLNVIALLNKSVPLIAIKMSAIDLGDRVGLSFATVLDLFETFDELPGDGRTRPLVERKDWEVDGYAQGLAVVDAVADHVRSQGMTPLITYTQGYVAVATNGANFLWAHPRKTNGRCACEFRVGLEAAETWARKLVDAGMEDATANGRYVKLSLTKPLLDQHGAVLKELIGFSEEGTRA